MTKSEVGKEWFFLLNGQPEGPATAEEIAELIRRDRKVPFSIWSEGMVEWQDARENEYFMPLFLPSFTSPVAEGNVKSVSASGRLGGRLRHIGSTIAIVLGVLGLLAGLNQMVNHAGSSNFITGAVVLLGGLAYRSAKKRNLSESPNSLTRKLYEGVLIAVMVAVVVLQNKLIDEVYTHPVGNLFAPIWAISAYLYAILKKRTN